jgi:hypothetical protein
VISGDSRFVGMTDSPTASLSVNAGYDVFECFGIHVDRCFWPTSMMKVVSKFVQGAVE